MTDRPPRDGDSGDRARRSAEALRANLRRRKEQARERSDEARKGEPPDAAPKKSRE